MLPTLAFLILAATAALLPGASPAPAASPRPPIASPYGVVPPGVDGPVTAP